MQQRGESLSIKKHSFKGSYVSKHKQSLVSGIWNIQLRDPSVLFWDFQESRWQHCLREQCHVCCRALLNQTPDVKRKGIFPMLSLSSFIVRHILLLNFVWLARGVQIDLAFFMLKHSRTRSIYFACDNHTFLLVLSQTIFIPEFATQFSLQMTWTNLPSTWSTSCLVV